MQYHVLSFKYFLFLDAVSAKQCHFVLISGLGAAFSQCQTSEWVPADSFL